MWSAVKGEELKVAGIIPWPYMPFETLAPRIQWWILDWAEGINALLIISLVLMVQIHVGAAPTHHFWDRHDVLVGMITDLVEEDDDGPKHKTNTPAAGTSKNHRRHRNYR